MKVAREISWDCWFWPLLKKNSFIEIKFVYYTVEVYNSLAFNIFSDLCIHYHSHFWNIFFLPAKNSIAFIS